MDVNGRERTLITFKGKLEAPGALVGAGLGLGIGSM